MESTHFEVLVAGAGIAGLTSAAAAVSRGQRVALVHTGPGSFALGAGCIEAQDVDHNTPGLQESLRFFREQTELAGCGFYGSLDQKRYLPTILGSFQRVSFAPFYLWNGDPSEASEVAVVGIRGLSNFDANFVAERLAYNAGKLERGSSYTAYEISLSSEKGTVPSTLQYGNRFDRELSFRSELREALKPIAAKVSLIILPGILGLKSGHREIDTLEKELGSKLCEVPTIPPSVPGMRLFNRMQSYLRKEGVEFFSGFPISELQISEGHCKGVLLQTPGRPMHLSAETVILATGPFSEELLGPTFSGFNRELQPVDSTGAVLAENLIAAGAILHNSSAHDGNAMAILTGYLGGMKAARAGVQYA